ncbi:hypothetical protein Z043_101232 [Scleropages formosus]|uniref:Uncharacterized protein n=1 Tax=Scleropages formosus TaxID=113540 RepID=A0A0P7VYQ6_SCLFO|nr:hypothetical protein Z043_101232 [Scleropages formosus]
MCINGLPPPSLPLVGNSFSQRPQPGSPLSTDAGMMGSHSLSHQGAQHHARKQRGGRVEFGGTDPQRRDASMAGENPKETLQPYGMSGFLCSGSSVGRGLHQRDGPDAPGSGLHGTNGQAQRC